MHNAARVEADKCIGCKLCVYSCPDPNVIMTDGKKIIVNEQRCKGCGLCVAVCPKDALKLNEAI